MDLKPGDIVAIRHYSTINPFTSFVENFSGDEITIRLTNDFALHSLLAGEPVALGYESSGKVYLISCDILSINLDKGNAVLKSDWDESFANLRSHERFPISLYADITEKLSRKKSAVIIRDLSQYGMLVYSKEDFAIDEVIEMDIYTEKDVVFIKGVIVRKAEGPNYKKYGLMIRYENLKAINLIETYLKRLKFSYEQQIRKLRSDY